MKYSFSDRLSFFLCFFPADYHLCLNLLFRHYCAPGHLQLQGSDKKKKKYNCMVTQQKCWPHFSSVRAITLRSSSTSPSVPSSHPFSNAFNLFIISLFPHFSLYTFQSVLQFPSCFQPVHE